MSITATGINHFAVSVRNLEESVEWYDRVLGFKLIRTDCIPGISVRTAHMTGYGILLEIFDAENSKPLPDSRKHPNDDLKVQGNKYFSISISDRDLTKRELEELGVKIVMTADVWNTYGIFINDPTGNLIELFEGNVEAK